MSSVGWHGIESQSLLSSDLNKLSYQLLYKKIIIHFLQALTPPKGSFQLNSLFLVDVITYMHSLNH